MPLESEDQVGTRMADYTVHKMEWTTYPDTSTHYSGILGDWGASGTLLYADASSSTVMHGQHLCDGLDQQVWRNPIFSTEQSRNGYLELLLSSLNQTIDSIRTLSMQSS
ncbi:hypothetical protein AB4K20DRAFT_1870581 [Rhizopus microsporus]